MAHQARRDGAGPADDGGRLQPHQHGARGLAARRARGARPHARGVAAAAGREASTDATAAGLPTWYGSTWFDHENLRDDRVEAFSSYLYGGTYDYTYVARATTLGEFVVPPAKAEEIYTPEVFGRTASDRVVIG